jgi:hypothetical protein
MNNRFTFLGERFRSYVLSAAAFLSTGSALAQPEEPGSLPRVEPDDEPASVEDPQSDAPEGDSQVTPRAVQAQAAPTREQYEALEARLAALEASQTEKELTALSNEEAEAEARHDILKIYGFLDMGFQKTWVDESTIIAGYFDTNAWTFAMGNVDFYFDVNPHPDWRGLAEIRFTNAPRGRINNFGGIAGTFERENTQQFDPGGTVANAPIWLGGVIIERAWIEWQRYQSFRVRTGHFFTPFGIWNVDHGSPTLISAFLPQFIQQMYFPIRQTGVQGLGSFFAGEWEFAYRAWISNGREDENNLDFNDDKAFGTRIFARKDVGQVKTQIGASYHRGRVANKVVNITSVPPASEEIRFDIEETVAYRENIVGVDLSVDVGRTRFRTEGVAQLTEYEQGKRPPPSVTSPIPGAQRADDWRYSAYVLLAHELPWWRIEPYVYVELMQQNFELPDGLVNFAPGFNVYFNPATQLKVQASHVRLFDWTEDLPGDPGIHTSSSVVGRIVLAF